MPSRRVKRRRARRKANAVVAGVISPYRNLDTADAIRRTMLQVLPEQRSAMAECDAPVVVGRIWPEL